ncbi:hypothetical protein NL676_014400 [Syzygium grande]|nr:hypothetical protein NL676_014400 [Syzygium grande]
MKVEKQLKSSKRFSSKTSLKGTSYFRGASSSKYEGVSLKAKGKEKLVEPVKETSKKIDGNTRKCFKCHGYGHLQANCPNRRVMTLQEIEKIDLELQEASDEHDQNDSRQESENIAEKADDGKLLVIRRALHAKITPEEKEQRENIFHTRCTINGRCVYDDYRWRKPHQCRLDNHD